MADDPFAILLLTFIILGSIFVLPAIAETIGLIVADGVNATNKKKLEYHKKVSKLTNEFLNFKREVK